MVGRSDDVALFVAMPGRHLRSASALRTHDHVAFPAGRLGDLRRADPGVPIYFVELDEDDVAAPAATWRGSLLTWTEADDEGRPVGGLPVPPTWLAEREAADLGGADTHLPALDDREAIDDEEVEEDEEDDPWDPDDPERPMQVFLEVAELTELPPAAWVFTNEVVPKQQRGSRYFVPMAPRLVHLPA